MSIVRGGDEKDAAGEGEDEEGLLEADVLLLVLGVMGSPLGHQPGSSRRRSRSRSRTGERGSSLILLWLIGAIGGRGAL